MTVQLHDETCVKQCKLVALETVQTRQRLEPIMACKVAGTRYYGISATVAVQCSSNALVSINAVALH